MWPGKWRSEQENSVETILCLLNEFFFLFTWSDRYHFSRWNGKAMGHFSNSCVLLFGFHLLLLTRYIMRTVAALSNHKTSIESLLTVYLCVVMLLAITFKSIVGDCACFLNWLLMVLLLPPFLIGIRGRTWSKEFSIFWFNGETLLNNVVYFPNTKKYLYFLLVCRSAASIC